MEETKSKNKPIDIIYEMSKERTHLSYENNLMSWIRTALSLVGFGIGIFEVADKTGGTTVFKSSKLVGLFLIVLGISSLLAAINENKKNHASLLNNEIRYNRKSSLAFKIGIALVVISGLAMIRIIVRMISGQ